MDKMIGSYPQVFNIGHRAIADLFLDPVLVQEKIDGSQFSFCRVVDHEVWTVYFRSKGATVLPEAPGMFKLAVEIIQPIAPNLLPKPLDVSNGHDEDGFVVAVVLDWNLNRM